MLNNTRVSSAQWWRLYNAYLRTPQWRRLRAQCVRRDGARCVLCNEAGRLEVHHRHYPPIGQITRLDRLSNLTTLCHACHHAFTNRARGLRYAKKKLVVTEHQRMTPIGEVHIGEKHLPSLEVSYHRPRAIGDAQWPARRSAEPVVEEHRRTFWQERQG